MLGTDRLGPEHDWLCKNVILEHDLEGEREGEGGGGVEWGRGREREQPNLKLGKSKCSSSDNAALSSLSLKKSQCYAGDKKKTHIKFVA